MVTVGHLDGHYEFKEFWGFLRKRLIHLWFKEKRYGAGEKQEDLNFFIGKEAKDYCLLGLVIFSLR